MIRPRAHDAFCCVLLLLLAGCAHVSRPFPVGLYDVPASDFPLVAEAGFNTVVGPVSKQILAAARTNGIRLIGQLTPLNATTVRPFDDDPALAAWYLFDEPDLHRISPWEIADRNSRFRRFSSKPSFLVLSSGAAVEKYRGTADLIGVDWYPVAWAPLATLAREMRLARLGMQGRPFYAVLQAFDWNIAPELLHTSVPLRAPTREELRCMTYLALSQGAVGVLFYTYDNGQWKMRDHPELWDTAAQLAFELQQNAPIFANHVSWWPIETETHGSPEEMYNEIYEARVLLNLYHVEKPSLATLPGYYLVAINTSASPTDFSFKMPFAGTQTFPASCPAAEISTSDSWLRKTYAPFEVCIFGPIKGPLVN